MSIMSKRGDRMTDGLGSDNQSLVKDRSQTGSKAFSRGNIAGVGGGGGFGNNSKSASNNAKGNAKSVHLMLGSQSGKVSINNSNGKSFNSPAFSLYSDFPAGRNLFSHNPNPFTGSRANAVKSTVGFDKSRNIRAQVEKAMREGKIFSCVGVYPPVRRALLNRGWVEKNCNLGTARSTNLANLGKDDANRSDEESDQVWMNRVLHDYPPDFYWVIRRDNIDWRSLHKGQTINRYPKAFFTTKVGIAACLQNMQWYSETGVSDTFFPRCYRLCIEEEKLSFIDDYRLSACMGLLKWVIHAYERDGESGVMDRSSRVVSLAVDFAVRQVNNYVRMRRHEDIDWLMPPAFMGQHWDVFLNQYYGVVLQKCKLAPNDSQDTGKLKYEAAKRTLQRIAPYWPQLHIDGMNNIWICKPGARSRGKGIVILNQLDKILDLLNHSNCRDSNWVVQKYIERPLIIYNTKFDLRQWFIVSDWSPLTVWFYKESYVRFCSKPFSLDDFHESIHLCNNAVQCRYQNSEVRDSALPDENMWDCYTFQNYLKNIGKAGMWDSVIYPGMKQGILGVLLSSQETADVNKNCFELYGADFMLSDDLRPWLIEINSCPCMAPSTSVTARMCAQCLEDCIKVIIDRRENKNADTGLFELIYKQGQAKIPVPFGSDNVLVQGKKLSRDVDWPSIMTKYNSKRAAGSASGRMLRVAQNPSSMSHGLTFMDLVQRLRLKESQLNGTTPPVSTSNAAPPIGALQGSRSGAKVTVESSKSNASVKTSDSSGQKSNVLNAKSSGNVTRNSSSNHNSGSSHNNKENISLDVDNNNLKVGITPSRNITNAAAAAVAFKDLDPNGREEAPSKTPERERSRSGSKSGKSSHRRHVRVYQPTVKESDSQSNILRLNNNETLLSTLLKSTVSNQPNMDDLIRISQAAAQETIQRARISTFGHTNPDLLVNKSSPGSRCHRSNSRTHQRPKSPSSLSTGSGRVKAASSNLTEVPRSATTSSSSGAPAGGGGGGGQSIPSTSASRSKLKEGT